MYSTRNWENSLKKSVWFSKKSNHNFRFWQFVKSMYKKSHGNTIVPQFLQSIWFHSQKKDEATTTCIWSFQRNCYSYNYALQKYENNGSFTWWQHWLLWHSHRNFTRRYISAICVYDMRRLRTLKVDRSNKEMVLHLKKKKKKKKKRSRRKDILQKLWQMKTTQMF